MEEQKKNEQAGGNYDRDEGSTVVLLERKALAELREKSRQNDSCILFYCKNCQAVVEAEKVGRRYSYICKPCGSREVAFGTQASIAKFFRLKEQELTPMTTLPKKLDTEKVA